MVTGVIHLPSSCLLLRGIYLRKPLEEGEEEKRGDYGRGVAAGGGKIEKMEEEEEEKAKEKIMEEEEKAAISLQI